MSPARLPKLTDRTSGVLLHPTSLVGSPDGGDLGRAAYGFVDFLAAAGQSWWQMLPVGPTGYGNSPYSAHSAFAGSPALISIERLVEDGLLSAADRDKPREQKLRAAFAAFENAGGDPDQDAFVQQAADWLEDFSLYSALKHVHGKVQWTRWPVEVRDRDPAALEAARRSLARDIAFVRFEQWRFAGDWKRLRAYAHARGIALIGDIPIFMAHDSADVWQNRALFYLDAAGEPALIAGVPPDYFSATGQRWGNPLYRWDRMRANGYAWWIQRFRATLAAFDAIRLDHFIGFVRYWEIAGHEPTAVNGHWREGPGAHFFEALAAALDARGAKAASPPQPVAGGLEPSEGSKLFDLPLIAEDLGAVTPEVKAVRDRFGLPGIKILQFAFGTDPNAPDFLPHNYPRRAVVYTGTHDNDTTVGWFSDPGSGSRTPEQTEKERRTALQYLGRDPDAKDGDPAHDIHWQMIRMVLMSVADVAIIQVQDLLGLGSVARMNRPGTDRGNWEFRLPPDALTPAIAGRLRELCATYDRLRAAA